MQAKIDTMRESHVAVGAIAVILALAVYGYWSWFFPSTIVQVAASLPAVGLATWLALALKRRPNSITPPKGVPRIGKPFLIASVLVFGGISAWVALAVGLPAMVTVILSPNAKAIAIVHTKSMGIRRSCDYKLGLVGYGVMFKDTFCVTSAVWNRVKVGDKVDLQIRKDLFGTRIYELGTPES